MTKSRTKIPDLNVSFIEAAGNDNSVEQTVRGIETFLVGCEGIETVSVFKAIFENENTVILTGREKIGKISVRGNNIAAEMRNISAGNIPQVVSDKTGLLNSLGVFVPVTDNGYLLAVSPNTVPDYFRQWFLESFPRLAGLIIERSRFLEQFSQANFRERLKELNISVLQDIGIAVTGTLDIGELTGELIQRLVSVINVNKAAVLLSETVDRRAGRGGTRKAARTFGLDSGDTEKLIESINAHSLWDNLKVNRLIEYTDSESIAAALGCSKAIAAGIFNRDELLGMIILGGKEERGDKIAEFSAEDKNILVSVANFSGAALANSKLYNSVLKMKQFNDDILRSIANGVITTDTDGRIDSFNLSAEKIFGLERESVKGIDVIEFFRSVGAENAADSLSGSLVNGSTYQQTRIKGKNSSGEDLVFNLSANSFRDKSDRTNKNSKNSLVISIENISEHARIREMLASYVAPAVAEYAISGKHKLVLGGEKKEVTVLFADIRGFTKLSETKEPEEIVELLNSFFDLMIETVFNFGGTVDKIIGDEIMVLFGAPFEFRDDTSRAVRCALAMLDQLDHFNREREKEGLFPVSIGIGINRGRVVSGNIGSTRQMSYTVIGDAVNIAKRLVDIAKPCQILISAAVKDRIDEKDFVLIPESKPVTVKGRTEPVDIFQVKNRKKPKRNDTMPDISKYRVLEEKIYRAKNGTEVEIAGLACEKAEAFGFGSETVEEIRLAVIETVINAIEHGSEEKDQVVARIAETFDGKSFVVMIRDFGGGFDSEKTETPDIKKKIHVKGSYKRGWGLKLIKEMVDEVSIESDDNGTLVTLIKHGPEA